MRVTLSCGFIHTYYSENSHNNESLIDRSFTPYNIRIAVLPTIWQIQITTNMSRDFFDPIKNSIGLELNPWRSRCYRNFLSITRTAMT